MEKTKTKYMKKKSVILIPLLLLAFAFSTNDQKERSYQISIPEHLANAAFQMFNGNGEQLTVKEYKEVLSLVNQQFQFQAKQFQIQDSIENKTKKDSTNHK